MPRLDSYTLVDADLQHEVLGISKNPLSPEFEDTVTMTLSSVKDAILSEPVVMPSHALGNSVEAVNVIYGTSATPPPANTVPQGTIYFQYLP